MRRKGILITILFLAGIFTLSVLAKNQDVVPKVEILSPISGTATNQNSIDVAVWFSAYKEQNGKPVGNVHTVKLLLNGQVVGTYQNPPNIKSGGVNFTVNLAGLPEGQATLQAIAFQGNQNAGHQGNSNIVTIIIDRTVPTMSIIPANGEVLATNTPIVKVQYSDTIAGVNTTTLHVLINGVERTALFTVTGSEATLLLTQDTALVSGENTIVASITDKAGNQGQVTSTFTVGIAPPARLTVPEFWPTEFTVPGRPDYELQLQALVTDAQGKGVPAISVLFRIVEGTGTIGSTEVTKTTDQDGIATATFKPDNQEGDTKVSTTLPDYPNIQGMTYTIHKTYHVIPGIVMDSPAEQEGIVNRPLVNRSSTPPPEELISKAGSDTVNGPLQTPLQVKVVDTNHGGASLKGEEVKFSVVSGSGLIVKAPNLTNISNQDGIAGVQYLPGDGQSQVVASLWSNPEQKVTFNITGHMPILDPLVYIYPPSVMLNYQPLASGFIEQSSVSFPIMALTYDWQGQAIDNTPVKFEKSNGTANVTFVLGRPVPDGGVTCSNMVMDSAGDFNVKISLPEFNISQDVRGTRCYKLEEIVMAESGLTPPKNIIRAIVPSIALIKQGNGQTGAPGEKLQIPLTVETRNIFGTVPDKTKFEKDLKNYYVEEVKKRNKQNDFEIVSVILSCKVFVKFSVFFGGVSLVPDTTLSTMNFSSTPQEYPPGTNVTKVQIKTLPHNIQANISQQMLQNKMLKNKVLQNKMLQSTGVIEKDVYLPVNNPGGQASVNVVYDEVSTYPAVIMAQILWGDFNADIVTWDHNSTDGFDIYSLPAPSESGVWGSLDNWTNMEAYFTIAPPEVKFVSQETTQEGKVEYKDADYLLPWPVFNLNDTLNTGEQKKYRIEAKLPLTEPPTTKCGLDCLDDCREKITDIPGKIGELHADQLDMVRADDQPDTSRYLLYRSAKPFVFITHTTKLDQAKPDLPDQDNTTYIQTNGFAKPFVYADEKIEGKDNPDLRILTPTALFDPEDGWMALGGRGRQFVEATFPEPTEMPRYWYAQLLRSAEEEQAVICFRREVNPANVSPQIAWAGTKPDILFINGMLNFEICLIDGYSLSDPKVPVGEVLSPPNIETLPDGKKEVKTKGKIAISGVQQGDWIYIDLLYKPAFDMVGVVKNFSWNDLKRFEALGKPLDFAPEFTSLPPAVRTNVINTIKFALRPPTGSLDPKDQEKQRIDISSELENKFSDVGLPGLGLSSLPIPSAKAVGFGVGAEKSATGDMYHFHPRFTVYPSEKTARTILEYHNKQFDLEVSMEKLSGPKFYRNRPEIIYLSYSILDSIKKVLQETDKEKVNNEPSAIFIYHTYEYVRKNPKYVHPLVEKALENRLSDKVDFRIFCPVDPIRNIRTPLSNNNPSLYYCAYAEKVGTLVYNKPALFNLNSGYRDEPPTAQSALIPQIDFFVNRKGEIFLFYRTADDIIAYTIAIADALGEKYTP